MFLRDCVFGDDIFQNNIELLSVRCCTVKLTKSSRDRIHLGLTGGDSSEAQLDVSTCRENSQLSVENRLQKVDVF